MKIGVFVPLAAANAGPEFLQAVGQGVEQRGFESVWATEHVVLFDEYD